MSTIRAILVSVVALSVAILPVSVGKAGTTSPQAFITGMQADCCPHGTPCDKRAPGDCAPSARCVLKCFNVLGATSFAPAKLPSEKSLLLISSAVSRSDNPPVPPPRA
jgi:hypothetical protein